MQARQWKVERASQVLGGIHRSGAHRRSLGPRCPPSNLQALSQLSRLSQGHWVTQHPNKAIVFHTRFRNNEDLVQAHNKRLLGTGARSLPRSLLERGSRFAVVIALHVLQVGLVTPLLRAYLQRAHALVALCGRCLVLSVCGFPLDYRERGRRQRSIVARRVRGRIEESFHEVEVRWIRE